MKFKTTKKEIMENFPVVVEVGYCWLQHLLRGKEPVAYTCGVYGWNADIYDLGGGVAIVTGYRPFGNINPDYERLKRFEKIAEKIWCNTSLSYEERTKQLDGVLTAFIEEVRNGTI